LETDFGESGLQQDVLSFLDIAQTQGWIQS
jgi:hypothetical protein